MHERGMLIHIFYADFDRSRNRNILLGVLAVFKFAFIRRVADIQRRLCAEHGYTCICRCGITVPPRFRTDLVAAVIVVCGNCLAIVGGGIPERQLRFEDIDVVGRIVDAGFCRCRVTLGGGRSTHGLGRYGNFDGIGRIFGQVFKLVRNDIAVFVLDRNGDINVLGLPGIKAVRLISVGCLAEIKLYIANADFRAILELIGGDFALEVDVLVGSGDGHVLNGNIDFGLLEGHNRGLRGTVLVDTRACIGDNIVAAQETALAGYIKRNNQFFASNGGIALRIRFGAAPVFGEVKAGYANLVAADRGRYTATAAAGAAPCVDISGFSGAVISIDSNVACCRPGRQREVRGDNVFHNRLAAQRGLRTARLDLVGNLLENVVQRSRVTSREVVAGRAGSSVVGRNFLHKPVTGSRHFCFCIVSRPTGTFVIFIWLFSCGACVSAGENAYGVHGSSFGFDCVCSRNCTIGNVLLESVVVCRRAVCKDDHHTVARLTSWNRIGVQNTLCHDKAVVCSCRAARLQRIKRRGYVALTVGCAHVL